MGYSLNDGDLDAMKYTHPKSATTNPLFGVSPMSNETKKPTYWRSFDELAQSEDWKSLASHEFEYGTSLEPLGSGQTRRHFLGLWVPQWR